MAFVNGENGAGDGKNSLNTLVVCTSLLASLGGFLFGYDIGYIGPIESFPGFQRSVNGDREIGTADRGFITAIFSLGAVLASFPLVSSYLNDGIGRRRTIILGSILFCMGAAIQATAFSVPQILLGRFISGLSVGSLSSTVPMYQSETAPQEWRGMLGATYQWCITLGILVSFWVDHAVNPNDGWGWRIAIWVQVIPSLVLLVGMIAAPSSPRWLMLCGRKEEAIHTLRSLRTSQEDADLELYDIEASLKINQTVGTASLRELFAFRFSRRLTFVGMTVMLLQQLCGMNAFMYYGTIIFGGLQLSPAQFNPIMGAVNVIATIPGLLLVDRVGRVQLLRWSGAMMFIACLACAAALSQFPPECMSKEGCGPEAMILSPWAAHGFVAAMFIFICGFAFGWGPVAWVYCAEIFPLRFRSMAIGVTTCTCWVGNYMVAHFTPVLLDEFHFWTFLIFAFFCGLGVLLSAWLPETQGAPLEEIPKLFAFQLGVEPDAQTFNPAEPLCGDPLREKMTAGYASLN
jgi:sugar porter (SP) family MFS transporter